MAHSDLEANHTSLNDISLNGIKRSRFDLELIAKRVPIRARVLDIGCGDGSLLQLLEQTKNVDARGIEISNDGVRACLSKGLSVIQGDANTDLETYVDNSFDVVILSQTLQATNKPNEVLKHLVRIGKIAIVSVPNFAYWKVRLYLLLKGKMPVTSHLAYSWYNTPNIHFCTMRDFMELVDSEGYVREKCYALTEGDKILPPKLPLFVKNWLAHEAIFVLSN